MSLMIEVFLKERLTSEHLAIVELMRAFSGRLTYEEENERGANKNGSCLTFEFETSDQALLASEAVKAKGIHVEGPYDY